MIEMKEWGWSMTCPRILKNWIVKQMLQDNTQPLSFPHSKKHCTFHEYLILGHALEQFVVLRVVLADSLCRGTGQSHEQLLGGPACLHSTSTTGTTGHSATTTGHSGSARCRHHPLPQRTRALHQAQHVGTVHAHTLAHIQGLEQAAARHTLFPLSPVSAGQRWSTASVQLPLVYIQTHTWL